MKARHLPTPTAGELAQHRADIERLRQMREAQREADAQLEHCLRGRHISVGGHDGKVMYARFTRPHYEHLYRVWLPHYNKPSTRRFFTLMEKLGVGPERVIGSMI